MWEMIQNMASDRLWIYTGIVGSLFGAAFLFWFKDTRMAMWAVRKFDASCENCHDVQTGMAKHYGFGSGR